MNLNIFFKGAQDFMLKIQDYSNESKNLMEFLEKFSDKIRFFENFQDDINLIQTFLSTANLTTKGSLVEF